MVRPQKQAYEAMERTPSQTFYGLTFLSIIVSAVLFLTGRRTMAIFVGEWAPTFLLIGIANRLLRPSTERPVAQLKEAVEEMKKAA